MMSLKQFGLPALAICMSVASFATAAEAKTTHFRIHMTGGAETPPNTTTGTGAGSVSYNDKTHMLKWSIHYKGLTGPAIAAHFHGPAAAGVAAKPVVPIAKDKIASPIKGSATLTDDQAQQLLAGMWYFNVHTKANPNGEIRGQVIASTMKPMAKPATGPKMVPTDIPSSNNESGAPQGSPPPVQAPAK